MNSSSVLNLNEFNFTYYGGASQQGEQTITVQEGGEILQIVGNAWNKINFSYTITPDTILEFHFLSTSQGDVHGIGFDTDNTLSQDRTFKLYGTQKWGNNSFENYQTNPGTWRNYQIPVGQFYTGDVKHLFFVNDHDINNPTANSNFANIRVYEQPSTLSKQNAIPIGNKDRLTALENKTLLINSKNLLLNDSDPDGDLLTITGVKNAYKGTVVLNSDGSINFTPSKYFVGSAGFTYVISDGKGGTADVPVNINVNPNYYDFSSNNIYQYRTHQDKGTTVTPSVDGKAITVTGDTWRAFDLPYNITPNTVVQFKFKSTASGNIHAIGFDQDLNNTNEQLFQLYGTATSGNTTYKNYSGNDWRTYSIPVGQFYTGQMNYLVIKNDHNVQNPIAESQFKDVYIYEGKIGNDKPVAVDDQYLGLTNAPVTIKISKLLANDYDPEGDSLSVKSVKSVTGGTAKLDNQGNVIFTPTKGFSGEASFEYILADDGGATDTGTVSVTVRGANIGTNLGKVAYHSTEVAFLDMFKSSSEWITQKSGIWDTKEQNLLALDEDGWVKSLSGTGDSQQFNTVGKLLYNSINGRYRGGRYVVLYEGEGTLEYQRDATKVQNLSTPGRDVIDVTPTDKGVFLKLTATDPKKTGNYLRNIRVVPIENEFNYQTEIFNPTFLDKVKPFSTLRFMDWMNTNNTNQKNWSDHPTLTDDNWSKKGVPVEVMVELANRLDVNPWFNLPHQATDEYVQEFARQVKNNLEPGLKVYVEYSNEVWNPMFGQYHWVEALDDNLTVHQSYGKRATEIMNIWDDVFAEDSQRVIGVMGAQAANWGTAINAMKFADNSIDAIAINPYFGGYIGKSENEAEVESWTKDPDGGLNKLFDEIMHGGVLTNGKEEGSLIEGWSSVNKWRSISEQYNVPIIAYEGGQHLVGRNEVKENGAINNLFIKANRDPRMGEAYTKQLTQWYELLGGELFMNYSSIGKPTNFGSWGALEYVDQESSPKYDALINFINQHSSTVAN
ncbi:hypothetical protein PCC7424_0237 [Gloeothece citriformis PCC 7424]|uniref:Cadherin-like domain-containing protein n=1 Tax=Gloeothece citriformis (strain PCC 7424) TaxID=65393 RepID=B7KAN3_GLOC7|nr:cadherin-like domain-containing protein [Gloeothece citriformis]ACK68705.1 hypothetical protein PCC7424_0237 [Gloeothece citriformis PCC 7424]